MSMHSLKVLLILIVSIKMVLGYEVEIDKSINEIEIIQFEKTFGGSDIDWANSIIQTNDGGYVVAGWTKSFGAGNADMYTVKLDRNGNKLWQKTFGKSEDDEANSIIQTNDGEYNVPMFYF